MVQGAPKPDRTHFICSVVQEYCAFLESHRPTANLTTFCFPTGAFNDQGYDPAVVAELAAAAAAAGGRGSSGSLPGSPDKGSKGLRHSNSTSSVKSRLRDTAGDAAAAAANVAAAAVRGEVVAAMLDASLATAAAAAEESGQPEGKEEQQQHEGAADAEQQQQHADSLQSRLSSYASWASDKASSAWSSQSVQVGPMAVLNMCSQACRLVCCPGGFQYGWQSHPATGPGLCLTPLGQPVVRYDISSATHSCLTAPIHSLHTVRQC